MKHEPIDPVPQDVRRLLEAAKPEQLMRLLRDISRGGNEEYSRTETS